MSLFFQGVIFRYAILFPLRLVLLLVGLAVLISALLLLPVLVRDAATRARYQRFMLRWICGVFVMSWTGVIRYHGVIPARRTNQIYVSNHTSMIDMLVLQQMNTFAVVGQKHKGWIAVAQERLLGCLGCIWFDRASMTNRDATALVRAWMHFFQNSDRFN
jgi:glycerol-3-phosphate O-acyltransferase 3/4